MSKHRCVWGIGVLAVLTAPLSGQERSLTFRLLSGGYSHTRNLNVTGPDAHFKLGYVIGTGVGVQINEYVVLQADASLARTEGTGSVAFVDGW